MIYPITLPLPLGGRTVNCYLLPVEGGFVLIDCGAPNARKTLLGDLERLGCRKGELRLIAITHGDFDHTGNAAYLRETYGGVIAMHPGDALMAEAGDMFANRRKGNALLRALVPKLVGFGKAERFIPDVLLADGASLEEYGLAAQVVSIPGHSLGSVGLLTAEGDFFCGDLLENSKTPGINGIMDDPQAAAKSVEKLSTLGIKRVYPGHGAPFTLDQMMIS